MKVVGVMSGTSVDAIDVVVANITANPDSESASDRRNGISISQEAFGSVAWEPELKKRIFSAMNATHTGERVTPADLCRLNFDLGEAYSTAILSVLSEKAVPLDSVDLICCHGQTIWHDVAPDGHVTSTTQLGESSVIAARTGITTVSDVRVADVAVGGQGAPLMSTFDSIILQSKKKKEQDGEGVWRALQNIGGIGNVTLLPPKGHTGGSLAFDTGPGNVLIDALLRITTNGEMQYDKDGLIARGGKINEALLQRLLSHEYFQRPPPKTTGRELFGDEFARQLHKDAETVGLLNADLIATVTEFTALSIVQSYQRWSTGPISEVMISGGGAHNLFLVERIQHHLDQWKQGIILIPLSSLGIDGDAKECLLMALLGYLCVEGLSGNVPECTGASQETVLGKITPGRNFIRALLRSSTS